MEEVIELPSFPKKTIQSPLPIPSPNEFFDSESKTKIVQQCVDNLISPEKLAEVYKCVPTSIRNWVKKSGHSLPKNYSNNMKDLVTYNSSAPVTNIEVVLYLTTIFHIIELIHIDIKYTVHAPYQAALDLKLLLIIYPGF